MKESSESGDPRVTFRTVTLLDVFSWFLEFRATSEGRFDGSGVLGGCGVRS